MRTRSVRHLSAASVGLLTLALMPVLALPATGASRFVPPNVDVTVMHGNEAEDAIAINPTNPQNLVAMSTLPDVPAGLAVGVSFDGGQTWSRQVIGTGGQLGEICCDQQLAWDDYGNLWMVYLLNTNDNVPIAVSTDGGLTFQKVAEIVPIKVKGVEAPKHSATRGLHEDARGQASADQPSIAVGPNSVWVSWTSYPQSVVQGSGAQVTGLGQFGSFTSPETVPTSAGRGNYGDTAVGPSGRVMVIYQDSTSGQGGSHVYTATDPDGFGSAGFSRPRLLARSRVGGFDYIAAQPHRSVDAEASLAWDRSGGAHDGRVYAIWTQEVKNESDDTNIMFQYSDDEGASWSPATRLNDDPTSNSQFNPAIALDQTSGAVAASWYDARNDMGQGGSGDTDGVRNTDVRVWATFSTDGGATFAPNFGVSEGTSNAVSADSYFDYGDYTHAAFQSGRFYPAWSDNSNSTGNNPDGTLHAFDLYTAAIPIA
jgi:BNR/Asp-box repeat protein